MKFLSDIFTHDLSIDLGTANTLIYESGPGVVLNEPSVVAINSATGSIQAIGEDAKKMLGRTADNLEVIRPLKDGQINDFEVTKQMLAHFIKKVQQSRNRLFSPSPRVLVCVPSNSTGVERRAIRDSTLAAGARKVYLIEEPMAAAVGAGLPVSQAIGSMVVDIGGGTSEVAILSMNGIVHSHSIRVGGDEFDLSIVNYIRSTHGCTIGEVTAERIKMRIGSAIERTGRIKEMDIKGHSLSEGVPKPFTISTNDVYEALSPSLNNIVTAIRQTLGACPPELSADIAESGIVLTGGGALLPGLDSLVQTSTGLPAVVADEPLMCVVRGCGEALDSGYVNLYDRPSF